LHAENPPHMTRLKTEKQHIALTKEALFT